MTPLKVPLQSDNTFSFVLFSFYSSQDTAVISADAILDYAAVDEMWDITLHKLFSLSNLFGSSE